MRAAIATVWLLGATACLDRSPFQAPGGELLFDGNDGEGASWLALDGDTIFWTGGLAPDYLKVRVSRAQTRGGLRREILADDVGSVDGGIALDDEWLYWLLRQDGSSGGMTPGTGSLMRVPRDGSSDAETLVTGENMPCVLVEDGDSLYWTTQPNDPVPGAIRTLAKGDVAAHDVATVSGQAPDCGLAVDDTWLYFAARDTTTWTQTLYRVAKTGGAPEALLTHGEGMGQAVNSHLEQSVVLHDGWIYWSSYASPPGVFRVRADGSGQAETLSSRARAGALAIEGDDLFAVIRRGFEDGREIAGEEGGLLRTGLSGGTATELLSDQSGADDVVVDERDVYFSVGWAIVVLPRD